jgi:hypothetical protein
MDVLDAIEEINNKFTIDDIRYCKTHKVYECIIQKILQCDMQIIYISGSPLNPYALKQENQWKLISHKNMGEIIKKVHNGLIKCLRENAGKLEDIDIYFLKITHQTLTPYIKWSKLLHMEHMRDL